jgi:hypothetical protein
MKRRIVRTATACAVLLATGALSACGSDAETPAGSASTTGAETDSTRSGGAGLTAKTLSVALVDAQAEAGSVHMEASFAAAGETVDMTGDLDLGEDGDDPAMDLEMTLPPIGAARMILVDQMLYMNLGAATQDKYTKIDLSDESDPLGREFGRLMAEADPGAAVAKLDSAMTGLKAMGVDEVDGVEATHYRATLDTDAALEAGGTLDGLPKAVVRTLPRSFDYDIWVGNDDGLLRKMTIEMLDVTSVITLTSWGEPVEVAAPPRAEIMPGSPFAQPS